MTTLKSYPKHWLRPFAKVDPWRYGLPGQYGFCLNFWPRPRMTLWLCHWSIQAGFDHHPECDCDHCLPF